MATEANNHGNNIRETPQKPSNRTFFAFTREDGTKLTL
jgi:hypothetical protein